MMKNLLKSRLLRTYAIVLGVVLVIGLAMIAIQPKPEIPEINLPFESAYDVDWSPDGAQIVVALYDGRFEIRDGQTGESIRFGGELDAPQLRDVAWSPDGAYIVSGDVNGGVSLWSSADGSLIRKLDSRSQYQITDIVWLDSSRVASVSLFDGLIHVWSIPDGELLITQSLDSYVYALTWDESRSNLLVALSLRGVGVYFPDVERILSYLSSGSTSEDIMSVAVSPDGALVAGGSQSGEIFVWSAGTGEILYTLRGHNFFVVSLAWSQDGRTLASAGYDGRLILWEMSSGTPVQRLQGAVGAGENPLTAVTISPDGTRLAVSGSSNLPNGGVLILPIED